MKKKTIMILFISIMSSRAVPCQDSRHPHTQVISHLSEKIDPAGNIVYSSAFRVSWTILKEEVIGEDILLKDPVSMVYQLNSSPLHYPDKDDYLAAGGVTGNGVLTTIDSQMRKKFGIPYKDMEQLAANRNDAIVCYGRFQKSMRFPVTFETLEYPFMDKRVACFGIGLFKEQTDHIKLRDQAEIFDYRGVDNFIVRLSAGKNEEEIVLAKVPLQKTIKETVKEVQDRINNFPADRLYENDRLIIPKINLSVNKSYDELLGKYLANKGFKDYFFAEAGQDVVFSLDESGAFAASDATIVLKKGPGQRQLIFDRPFLLMVTCQDLPEPLLILWITNTDFLNLLD